MRPDSPKVHVANTGKSHTERAASTAHLASAMSVIVSMMIGAQVLGLLGILIALPATAALKIGLNILVFRREEMGLGKCDKPAEAGPGAPPPG